MDSEKLVKILEELKKKKPNSKLVITETKLTEDGYVVREKGVECEKLPKEK